MKPSRNHGGLFCHVQFLTLFVLLLSGANQARADDSNVSFFTALSVSSIQANQTAVVGIVVDVAPGMHTQSHEPLNQDFIKFQVTPAANDAVQFLDPIYPKGAVENFPELGNQSIYKGRIVVYVPFRVKANVTPGKVTFTGTVSWQACDDRVCYAPESKSYSLTTDIAAAGTAYTMEHARLFAGFDQSVFAVAAPAAPPPPEGVDADFFGRRFIIGASNVPLALAIALVVGVLFNLMPCVLPVVPLKAIGFFEVSRHSRGKCLALGAVFSLGVVAIFAILGVLIVAMRASLHFSWGEQFKYGWFIWPIVIVLVAFAFGMFGLFEVVLPPKVYDLAPSHESFSGNFFFGMLTAVLSTPCTAPMFAAILAWAALQPVALGVASIITVGVGMALPYLLLSAFPELTKRVPRTGPWSLILKRMMGFLVLAVAVYFAGGRLTSDKEFVWAVFGVIALAMLFLIIWTIGASKRVLPITAAVVTSGVVVAISLSITLRLVGGISWKSYTEQNFNSARATGKPVLVEFTANWCSNCLALEASVYHDPKVLAAIRQHNVILLRADLTQPDSPSWPEVNRLNPGGGIPLTVIYGSAGADPIKLTSLYTPQNLIDALDKAIAHGDSAGNSVPASASSGDAAMKLIGQIPSPSPKF